MFSPDGSKIVITTRGHDYVFNAENGRLLADLGETGETFSASFTADGSQLVTTLADNALLWDLGGGPTDVGIPIMLADSEAVWVNGNEVADGRKLAVRVLADDGRATLGNVIAVLDELNGAVVNELPAKGAQLPDGRFAVVLMTPEGEDRRIGPLAVSDPLTDELTELIDCSELESLIDFVN